MEKEKTDWLDTLKSLGSWVLSCVAAYFAGAYLAKLIGRGLLFGGAGFWSCVELGFFSAAAFISGIFCVDCDFMDKYFRVGFLRRIMFLTLSVSVLTGALGITYVVADALNFVRVFFLGLFDLGLFPWIVGVCVCVGAFVLVAVPMDYGKILFRALFGGRRPDKMPVPRDRDFALEMADRALKINAPGYAKRCYRTIIERTDKKADGKWNSDDYVGYFRAGSGLAELWWDEKSADRDPKEAVRWAERVMARAETASKFLTDEFDNTKHTGTVRSDHYYDDMQKFDEEFKRKVEEARNNCRQFAESAYALAGILNLAYGKGEGVKRDDGKAWEYLAMSNALRKMALGYGASYSNYTTVKGGSEAKKPEPPSVGFPYNIYDDWNRRWTLDHSNADEACYTLDKEFDQAVDVEDVLSDGVAYIKKAELDSGSARYLGRTFRL